MSKTTMTEGQLGCPVDGFIPNQSTLTSVDDHVLPFLGGFGSYQKWLVFLTLLPVIFIGFIRHSNHFYLSQPNKICIENITVSNSRLFHGPNNGSAQPVIYAIQSSGPNKKSKDQCTGCIKWDYVLESGLVENVVTKWDLVCGLVLRVPYARLCLTMGSIFGYLVFGVLADWFGRIPVLILSTVFTVIFGLSLSLTPEFSMFVILRFLEGFCVAGVKLSLYLLRIEFCLPEWRFIVTMMSIFVLLTGQLLMPIVAYFWRYWQVLQAVIVGPLLLLIPYIWIFPESLRWLLATQQYSKANDWIMRHIKKKDQANMELESEQLLAELQKVLQNKPKKTWILKIIGTNNLWKNIFVLCITSLTGYGMYHSLTMAVETQIYHKFYANYYIMVAICIMSTMAMCCTVHIMGRRWSLLMLMIVTMLSSLLQLGIVDLLGKKLEESDIVLDTVNFGFSFIGMVASYAVTNLSIFYCAEITPTVIRGGGLGLVMACANFGIVTDFIMELHNQKGFFLHHVLFLCCTMICFILILMLPETRLQSLPETLVDGDSYTRYTRHIRRSRKPLTRKPTPTPHISLLNNFAIISP